MLQGIWGHCDSKPPQIDLRNPPLDGAAYLTQNGPIWKTKNRLNRRRKTLNTENKRMFDLSQSEFERMKSALIELSKKLGNFRVDGLPHQFHFTVLGDMRHVTVQSLCHNLSGREDAGEDAGLKIHPPKGRTRRFLFENGPTGIAWRDLDGRKGYTTDQIIDSLVAPYV